MDSQTTHVFTTVNHAQTVQRLTACQIPFREVTLIRADGKVPALELSTSAWTVAVAGRVMTQN